MANDKIVSADFGGEGPRQVLGELMKTADSIRGVAAVLIRDNGEVEVWASDTTPADLSLIAMKMNGYAMTQVMGWETEDEGGSSG